MTKYDEFRNTDGFGEPTGFYHDGSKWIAYADSVTEKKVNEVTILASGSRTTSGDSHSSPIDVGSYKESVLFLDVTSASGTSPTLDVKVETLDSTSGKWFEIASFTQATASTQEMIVVDSGLGSSLSVSYTLGGTSPSFTFSIGSVLKT